MLTRTLAIGQNDDQECGPRPPERAEKPEPWGRPAHEVLDTIVRWPPKHSGLEGQSSVREVDAALTTPLPVASPASAAFSAERLSRMDDAMQSEIDAGHDAGISVMVARHGTLATSRGDGDQSLEGRAPLREDAIFHIASMTKPVIARGGRHGQRSDIPSDPRDRDGS